MSESHLIIPSKEITFDSSVYSEELLGYYISKSEFDEIVDKINHIAIEAFFKSRKNSRVKTYQATRFVIYFSVILDACLFVLVGLKQLFILSTILVAFSTISLFSVILYIYFKPITHLDISDIFIRDAINDYLKKLPVIFPGLVWQYEPFKRYIVVSMDKQ